MLTHKFDDLDIRTAVECKDYGARVDVPKLEAFAKKCEDFIFEKKVMVSRKGFSSGARSKAKRLGVALYTLDQAEAISTEMTKIIPIMFLELDSPSLEIRAKVRGDGRRLLAALRSVLLAAVGAVNVAVCHSEEREILEIGLDRLADLDDLAVEVCFDDLPIEIFPRDLSVGGVTLKVSYQIKIRCGWTDHLPPRVVRTNVETDNIEFFLLEPDTEKLRLDLFNSETALPDAISGTCWRAVAFRRLDADMISSMFDRALAADW